MTPAVETGPPQRLGRSSRGPCHARHRAPGRARRRHQAQQAKEHDRPEKTVNTETALRRPSVSSHGIAIRIDIATTRRVASSRSSDARWAPFRRRVSVCMRPHPGLTIVHLGTLSEQTSRVRARPVRSEGSQKDSSTGLDPARGHPTSAQAWPLRSPSCADLGLRQHDTVLEFSVVPVHSSPGYGILDTHRSCRRRGTRGRSGWRRTHRAGGGVL